MDRWVEGRRKFKLPRSKSPFNEKTIFVETERAKRRRRAFKFTRERLFVRSRARMGNQSTSKTSPFLSGVLPSERIQCQELLLNLICYKTILSTALGIWAKNCPGILFFAPFCPRDPLVLSSCPETDLGISLLCGDWPGRLRPRVRAAAGFAKASLQIWKV